MRHSLLNNLVARDAAELNNSLSWEHACERLKKCLEELNASKEWNLASEKPALLPPDAFILVHGKKGGHKLSVAFNILVAGLWDRRKASAENNEIVMSNSVMLLSMGEETRIQVNRIALAVPNTDDEVLSGVL